MAEKKEQVIQRELRSPRAAAIAGIVFSVLLIVIMALTTRLSRVSPEQITSDWLESWSGTVSLVLTLLPFAGIAFLWFTGVVRDRLGQREDRFFATIFLSSGIITVVLLFMWGAVLGAMVRIPALAGGTLANADIYVFGYALINEIIGNYALRIAGVYMTGIATLWSRTGLMPRWLTIITYILALGFLVAAERVRQARFIFPTWVLVVSFYILILNYRRAHDQEGTDGLTVAS
jgi:hypothetical protein